MAYQLGTDVTVYDARYTSNGLFGAFVDNLGYITLISDDNEFFATEKLKFVGGIDVMMGEYRNSDIVFSAPKIVVTGTVAIENEDKNSITFENSSVNFDKAEWTLDPGYQGKLIFSGDSKLNLTPESCKTLIVCDSISGTITLELDDSFLLGSTFSIQANSANNLVINNPEGCEVTSKVYKTLTIYTVNKSIKEVEQITIGDVTYIIKDESAHSELSRKQDRLSAGTGLNITNNEIKNTGLISATYSAVNESLTLIGG